MLIFPQFMIDNLIDSCVFEGVVVLSHIRILRFQIRFLFILLLLLIVIQLGFQFSFDFESVEALISSI